MITRRNLSSGNGDGDEESPPFGDQPPSYEEAVGGGTSRAHSPLGSISPRSALYINNPEEEARVHMLPSNHSTVPLSHSLAEEEISCGDVRILLPHSRYKRCRVYTGVAIVIGTFILIGFVIGLLVGGDIGRSDSAASKNCTAP